MTADRSEAVFFTNAALDWLADVLDERFGHRLAVEFDQPSSRLIVRLPGEAAAIVFDNLLPEFHRSRSDFACAEWLSESEGFESIQGKRLPLPGLASPPARLVEKCEEGVKVNYDVLGLVYWMLNRLEEVNRTDLDHHQRFPASNSHAFRYGYLDRPIIDEWLDVLAQIMRRLWPGLRLTQHVFSMKVSHDVDAPSRYGFRSGKGLIRALAGDLIKRKSLAGFIQAPLARLHIHDRLHSSDPYNTFDWIMDQSDRRGLVSTFYFIAGRTDSRMDGDYEITHPAIRALIRRIHERGHEIGLHPSFNTYLNPDALKQEVERLRAVMFEENIQQAEIGARMHYLRWRTPQTAVALEVAGVAVDSTLSYADYAGFRCGTCHEYPMFNVLQDRQLKLRVKPLIVMDGTVRDARYMGLGLGQEARAKIGDLKHACQMAKGCFTFLWHNNNFVAAEEKKFYQEILEWSQGGT